MQANLSNGSQNSNATAGSNWRSSNVVMMSPDSRSCPVDGLLNAPLDGSQSSGGFPKITKHPRNLQRLSFTLPCPESWSED